MSILFLNLFETFLFQIYFSTLFIHSIFIFPFRIYTQGRCDTQVVTSVAKLEPVVSPPYSVVVIVVMIVITFCLFSRQMQNYNLIFIFNFLLPTQNLKISNSEFSSSRFFHSRKILSCKFPKFQISNFQKFNFKISTQKNFRRKPGVDFKYISLMLFIYIFLQEGA